MPNYAALRPALSERLPIVTYTNLFWPVAATVWMSPQTERITGYAVADWVGNPGFFESVLHPGDRQSVLDEAIASRREKRAFSADYRIVAPGRRTLWVHDESVPVHEEGGRLELVQGYFVDITARKELEQQLLHSQKTEELGRLAGQVAHDFNNYLAAIHASADLLRGRLTEHDDVRYVREIVQSVQHAGALTRQLLEFGRRQQFETRIVALVDLVRRIAPVLRRVAGERVEIDFEFGEAPRVRIDAGRLEQALVNLVANARDALPDGGIVCVGTHSTAVRADERAERLGLTPGNYAVLAVSDTGPGMDSETRERAFEPFFTTKAPDHGTGLGLSIVDSVVRQAGGAVELDTAPGTGTRFRIFLPAV